MPLTQTYINSLIFKILKLILHRLQTGSRSAIYDGLKLIEDYEKMGGKIDEN